MLKFINIKPERLSAPLWNTIRLLVTCGLFFLFAGCGGSQAVQVAQPSPTAEVQIAILTPYLSNVTTRYVIERFQEEAEAKGWQVSVTDTANDFDLLVKRIEAAAAQDVDAIVLGMGDPERMTRGLEAAQQAGIPVFGLDAGIAPGVIANITSDNTDLGKASAEALVEAIEGEGAIIMFTHEPHPGVRERASAAQAVFIANPNITLLEKKHIDVPDPVDNARQVTQELLAQYADAGSIAGIWAGWDEAALGAVQAIEAAGRVEIKVVSVDGADFARAEIAKGGPFYATVAQDFDNMAVRLAQLIEIYLLTGQQPSDPWYKIPGKLIFRENVQK